MDKPNCEDYRERLEALQEFPCTYPFKFIVPTEKLAEAKALFPEGSASVRLSRTGKYASVGADLHVETADEVLAVYQRACSIEGVMAL